ncbi:hypothetical protein QU516_05565 [Moellerella wisconsensis]|uniref:beta family protein n=1 Tax=Moellerella wisconsensis TaxID=158849 RepID=UPI0025B06EE5|nr:hypothetical protein [Moellerella wisconsensis]WJW82885.1 hypothetical protein QU516_05565 [Moellerella wisconsensis]
MNKIYAPCIKNGLNDLKALAELYPESKKRVIPIILTTGTVFSPKTGEVKRDQLIDGFIPNWDGDEFIVDASRVEADSISEYNEYHGLTDQSDSFSRKIDFYRKIYEINENLIPAVSWNRNDDLKNIIQLLMNLKSSYKTVAIVLDPRIENNLNILDILLCLFADNENIIVVLNYGSIYNLPLPNSEIIENALDTINKRGVKRVILLSSSFPHSKPTEKDTWITSSCTDLVWQLMAINKNKTPINLIYGDFSASSPQAPSEFILGMKIIPSATYFNDGIWHQIKSGGDKEYSVYKDIARNIVSSAFFDDFCWGTKNIVKISVSSDGYGHSGTWNGYKTNVHIEEIIRILNLSTDSELPRGDYDDEE